MVSAAARHVLVDDGDHVGTFRGQAVGGPGTSDKLAAQVARRIEAEVIERDWPVGVALDSEPVLRERYRVSRTVLREAVRLVEHHQVARMRRGPGGGLIACAPDVGPATRAAVTYLELVGTGPRDVAEARRLIEPLAAASAAGRITEGGIETLRHMLSCELTPENGLEENLLHVELGRLTGNPVLELFVGIPNQLILRYVQWFLRAPKSQMDQLLRQTCD